MDAFSRWLPLGGGHTTTRSWAWRRWWPQLPSCDEGEVLRAPADYL
ncbi:hypothetical protein [Streptomyces sp. R41]|uniref:Uncharacterized protein n=1 Tax=Streptomyces sp. R41 TaxID=3238632 RepID=A0AB39R7C3_9ACTN